MSNLKRAKTLFNLNLRPIPSIDSTRIAVLRQGQEIFIDPTYEQDTHTEWVKVEAYVMKKYLKIEADIAEPLPILGNSTSKLGYHIMAGTRDTGLIQHLERMKNAKKPIAGLTILFVNTSNKDLPRLVKEVSPETVILGRIYSSYEPDQFFDDPANYKTWANGKQWVKNLEPAMQDPYVDYWQIANEWGTSMPEFPNPSQLINVQDKMSAFSEFYVQAAETARSFGKKITVGDFSVGQIEDYALPFLREMFKEAEKHGNPLNYHAYNGDMNTSIAVPFVGNNREYYYAGRFARWLDNYPNLYTIIGEAGAGDARYSANQQLEFERMKELDNLLRGNVAIGNNGLKARNVLFFAWWSLFPHIDWMFSNFKELLPLIEAQW